MPNTDTVEEGVVRIMRSDERARNDDKWLVYRFIRDVDGINMFIPFEDFRRMTAFETITRVRRHIQNDCNELLPTEASVARERKINMMLWRQQAMEWKKG